jgi:NADP-dependent 3-hydroxy acid dehydrogenase YdfG
MNATLFSIAAGSPRTALVTGASRGIGLAVSAGLVRCNLRVAMLARSADVLAREASALGAQARPVAVDLRHDNEVQRAMADVESWIGLPDVVVNCTGVFTLARVGSVSAAEFAAVLDSNLVAPFRLLHVYVPRMRARGSGHIVTVGSVADRAAYPENAAYAASKFGARAVHEVLREELRGAGVRVSLISPGPVDTALWDAIDPDTRPGFPRRDQMLSAEDVADAVTWVVTRPARVNCDELRLARQ